jgi:hypothetical protein
MGHEQDEFADFYRASKDSCLKAVAAVTGDRQLAEEQGPAPAPASARPGSAAPASPPAVTLAAFSVTNGPGDSTTLILRKGPRYPRLDPVALRQALARHGIPALVTVGAFCRPARGASAGAVKSMHVVRKADGSDAIVINGKAMPPGTRLSIGLFPGHTRMLLIPDGVPLLCGRTSRQPAARSAPAGTPIHSGTPSEAKG